MLTWMPTSLIDYTFLQFLYGSLGIPIFLTSTLGCDGDRKYIKDCGVTDLLELVMSVCGLEWSNSPPAHLSTLALCPWKI